MKIAMGNDHTAIELKNIIKEFVEGKGYEVLDLGTNSTESCDYPIYGEKVGRAVAGGEADLGIVICGTVCAANPTRQSCPDSTTTQMYWLSERVWLAVSWPR